MSEPADDTGSFIFSIVGRIILSMSSSDQLNSAIRRRAPGTERSTERPEDTSPRSILFFSMMRPSWVSTRIIFPGRILPDSAMCSDGTSRTPASEERTNRPLSVNA